MKAASIFEELEGRTVDGKFALLERIAGSVDCGVFLTVRRGTQKAAIKLLRAEEAEAEACLAQWEEAKTLEHPHLMQIFETGRFSIDGNDLVYVVTEHADEILSDVIKERPLEVEETRVILISVLSALSYLHARGFIHGHIRPSEIFRVADTVKISADEFLVSTAVRMQVSNPTTYDAPEIMSGEITPVADAWSVGMTLAEILTQRLPAWDWTVGSDPVIPQSLPRPYADIVRDCLRLDPKQRCSVREIKTYLTSESLAQTNRPPSLAPPSPRAPTGERTESPLTGGVPHERPSPGGVKTGPEAESISISEVPIEQRSLAELKSDLQSVVSARPTRPAATPRPATKPTRFHQKPTGRWEEIDSGPVRDSGSLADGEREPAAPLPELFTQYEEAERRRFRIMPVALGLLVLLIVVGVLLVRSGKLNLPWLQQVENAIGIGPSTQQSEGEPQEQAPAQSSAQPTAAPESESQKQAEPATPSAQSGTPTATTPETSAGDEAAKEAQNATAPPPQQAPEERTPAPPAPTPQSSKPAAVQAEPQAPAESEGEVAKQVMPSPSSAAISSMHGPVRVTVRVDVDRSGSVSDAHYVSPGEGNYFARIARRAAESWKFDPPVHHGRAQPSVWTLRFFFSHAEPEVDASREE